MGLDCLILSGVLWLSREYTYSACFPSRMGYNEKSRISGFADAKNTFFGAVEVSNGYEMI